MGQLVFQATAGGQVALVGPNPSTSFSINVPAINGNLITSGDTGTVTNTMLASNVYTAPGTIGSVTPNTGAFTNLSYTGTLTGGTGIVNLGSGQFYKDASGNLIVGGTSAINSAANRGNITVNGSSSAIISLGVGGVSKGYIYTQGTDIIANADTGDFSIQTASAQPVIFSTNATERMRIDSSGNLLVGTTSVGLSNSRAITFNPSSGGFTQNHSNTNGSGDAYALFGYNGTAIGSITQNGTTGVLYNLTSDYRLKDNPVPLTGASEFIMALQPKSWDWWDGSGKGVGFIAHEFMEVAKYSGNGEKDAVDVEGKPVYQSIQPSSSEVMANLVSLVQEQQALITDLQTRLTKAGL